LVKLVAKAADNDNAYAFVDEMLRGNGKTCSKYKKN
jgi:hypothetical protein